LARIGPDHGRDPYVIKNVDPAETIIDGEVGSSSLSALTNETRYGVWGSREQRSL
jgi:hypothetical protein